MHQNADGSDIHLPNDDGVGQHQACIADATQSLVPRVVRVATLNIWFDAKLQAARTDALIEVIKSMACDVYCLQEVVPKVAMALRSALPEWSCSDPGNGSTVAPYGVMILVAPGISATFSFHRMQTAMCRNLLVAEVLGLAIGTVHLESLANHPTRVEQLRVCESVLAPYTNALLVGDFNFDSQRNYKPPHVPLENEALAQIMPQFVDVWSHLRQEAGHTFDSTVNPYVTSKAERMRYDRVMARLMNWQAESIAIFGNGPVDEFRQLSAWEREHAERPPTPPRPQLRPRRSPTFELDEPSSDEIQSLGKQSGMRTPPRARSRFFLSDHFGLIATLAPIMDASA